MLQIKELIGGSEESLQKVVCTDKKIEWINKLDMLDEIIQTTPKEAQKEDSEFYIYPALSQVVRSMLNCDQFINSVDEPTKVRRLVKLHCMIPTCEYDRHKWNYIFLSGIYVETEAWLLPSKIVDKCWGDALSRITVGMTPEKYGLPSESEVMYTTLRKVSTDTYMAFGRSWLTDYVNRPHQWEYVYID